MTGNAIARSAATWAVTILAALGMLLAGSSKFTSPDLWWGLFEGWGYSGGFAYVVGAIETVGAIVLLVPRASAYAAITLGTVMVGAGLTHVLHDEQFFGPLIMLVLLAVTARLRWKSRWRQGDSTGGADRASRTGDQA